MGGPCIGESAKTIGFNLPSTHLLSRPRSTTLVLHRVTMSAASAIPLLAKNLPC
jgi:hypothetical protein